MVERSYVLTLGCPDRTGIVARIAGFLAEAGGTITEASYHLDPDTSWFFTRQLVSADSLPYDVDELRSRFADVAAEFGPHTDWRVSDTARHHRGTRHPVPPRRVPCRGAGQVRGVRAAGRARGRP